METDKNIILMQSTIRVLELQILELTRKYAASIQTTEFVVTELEEKIRLLSTDNAFLSKTIQEKEQIIEFSSRSLVELESSHENQICLLQSSTNQAVQEMDNKIQSANIAIELQSQYQLQISSLENQIADLSVKSKHELFALEKSHLIIKRDLNEQLSCKLQDAVELMKSNFKSKISNSLAATLDENKRLETYTIELVHLTQVLVDQNRMLMNQIEAFKVKNLF
eukprot:NODE_22_length_38364_cov_0.248661.p16 type:complete len:224 gc:universal NODE_22_length_38364_cov_0.248661:25850-25179(-)